MIQKDFRGPRAGALRPLDERRSRSEAARAENLLKAEQSKQRKQSIRGRRLCLRCQKPFSSWGIFNRLCDTCGVYAAKSVCTEHGVHI